MGDIQLSIVTPTFQRRDTLSRYLAGLTQLVIPASATWEILVVNNDPKDDLLPLVKSYASKLPVHYLTEERLGRSNALNKGVRASRGKWVAFFDDDVMVDVNWFVEVLKGISKYEDALFFGGRIIGNFPTGNLRWLMPGKAPDWLKGFLVDYDYGPEDRKVDLETMNPFYGTHIVILREWFDKNGEFDTQFGVVGKKKRLGEDTEIVHRLIGSGATGYYLGQAIVQHFITADRMTLDKIYEYFISVGEAAAHLDRNKTRQMTDKEFLERTHSLLHYLSRSCASYHFYKKKDLEESLKTRAIVLRTKKFLIERFRIRQEEAPSRFDLIYKKLILDLQKPSLRPKVYELWIGRIQAHLTSEETRKMTDQEFLTHLSGLLNSLSQCQRSYRLYKVTDPLKTVNDRSALVRVTASLLGSLRARQGMPSDFDPFYEKIIRDLRYAWLKPEVYDRWIGRIQAHLTSEETRKMTDQEFLTHISGSLHYLSQYRSTSHLQKNAEPNEMHQRRALALRASTKLLEVLRMRQSLNSPLSACYAQIAYDLQYARLKPHVYDRWIGEIRAYLASEEIRKMTNSEFLTHLSGLLSYLSQCERSYRLSKGKNTVEAAKDRAAIVHVTTSLLKSIKARQESSSNLDPFYKQLIHDLQYARLKPYVYDHWIGKIQAHLESEEIQKMTDSEYLKRISGLLSYFVQCQRSYLLRTQQKSEEAFENQALTFRTKAKLLEILKVRRVLSPLLTALCLRFAHDLQHPGLCPYIYDRWIGKIQAHLESNEILKMTDPEFLKRISGLLSYIVQCQRSYFPWTRQGSEEAFQNRALTWRTKAKLLEAMRIRIRTSSFSNTLRKLNYLFKSINSHTVSLRWIRYSLYHLIFIIIFEELFRRIPRQSSA